MPLYNTRKKKNVWKHNGYSNSNNNIRDSLHCVLLKLEGNASGVVYVSVVSV